MIHTETCSILSPAIGIENEIDREKNALLFIKTELAIKKLNKAKELKQISVKRRAKNETSLSFSLM